MFDFDLLDDLDEPPAPEAAEETHPPPSHVAEAATPAPSPGPPAQAQPPAPAPAPTDQRLRSEAKAGFGCATCGSPCRELADDGKRYCDKCWDAWMGQDKSGPVLLGKTGRIWQVIGGRQTGGITVAAEKGVEAEQALGLLSTGALVRALESDAGRLRYELLRGSGPGSGWVDAWELKEKPGWISTKEVHEQCGYRPRMASSKPKELPRTGAESADDQRQEAHPGVAEAVTQATEVLEQAAPDLDGAGVLRLYSERLAERVAGGPSPDQQKPAAQAEHSSAIFNRKSFHWGMTAGSARKGHGKGRVQLPFPPPALPPKPAPSKSPGQLLAPTDIARKVLLPSGKKLNLSCKIHFPHSSSNYGAPRLSFDGPSTSPPERDARSELRRELALGASLVKLDARLARKDWADDSDGERMVLCRHCHLPVGEAAYAASDGKGSLHGECMAEDVRQEMLRQEADRRREDAALKRARHEEHDIGWRASRIPAARRLACSPLPEGMCCLVFKDGKVRVAPTIEPAAAVNLEYLSIALQVRLRERREPVFSLDPVDRPAEDPKAGWQVKRFEPAWLAGTSAGEVLFQSDYHLKELSMGEYEQPVIGMKSCFEYSEQEDCPKEWSAREWFVVRQADVHLTEDDVLLPYLRMGVEAREQTRSSGGREDARITRPNHPLVKYAEAFTRNFDLIAERKSVVFHLRELAKASVLAKFLAEARASLDEPMLRLDEPPQPACCLEVPQLWNDRFYSRINVRDGAIVGAEEGFSSSGWALYGGVQFGLDRFRLGAGPAAALAAGPAFSRGGLRTSTFGAMARLSAGTTRLSVGALAPKGVDLSLDKFGLSAARRVQRTARWGSVGRPEAHAAVGSTFWTALGEASEPVLGKDERDLFRAVFNPHLSDRRDDGDLFVPPDTSVMYLNRLRALVREEEAIRGQRREHFCSSAFAAGCAGELFPSSWTDSFEVASGRGVGKPPMAAARGGALHVRPDYGAETQMFDQVLKSVTPSFDRSTEDGIRFRIYTYGSLEVRTVQEPAGREVLGAVLSPRPPPGQEGSACAAPGRGWPPQPHERIVRAALYVERAPAEAPGRPGAMVPTGGRCRYYAVLTTAMGGGVLTEQRPDGTVAWLENPVDLEGRNSLAKVLRSRDCHAVGITAEDLKGRLAHSQTGCGAPASSRKRYARCVYDLACGEAPPSSGTR